MVVNQILWVAGNVVGLLIFVSALIFSVAYPLLFKFRETTAGPKIWQAILSTAGFGLLAFLGIFVDGRVPAWELPMDVAWWRPLVRLIVYGFIGYSYGSLVWLLVVRRWFPKKIKTAPAGLLDVAPRHENEKSVPPGL